MRLYRAHGLGNDYLVLEAGPRLDAELVRAICDRHRGVGGDGVLEPADAAGADFGVRIWNPDGSLAEKSGNGLRIYARWLVDRRSAPSEFTVWTGHDAVTCRVGAVDVSVAMGRATFASADIPIVPPQLINTELMVNGDALRVVAVGMGNPHCVVFRCESDLDALPWRTWGAVLETHPRFPNRTNVQVARVIDRSTVEIRIWERGAGETLASGSSSCAVAAAGVETGRLDAGSIEVRMPGGTLRVHVDRERNVVLEGPVEPVGVIEVASTWLERQLRSAR